MSSSHPNPRSILEGLRHHFYKPWPQPYWYHDGSSWISSSSSTPPALPSPQINPSLVRLVSWNIDMQRGFAEERMSAALSHLSDIVASTPAEVPVVIFLQEMTRSDMRLIRETSWIQDRFYITDFDEKKWVSSSYGTTTFVDRRLKVAAVFRVPWTSDMGRDGLFVDLPLSGLLHWDGAEPMVLRLCNTHLESLRADPPIRPSQLKEAAEYLREAEVTAGLLAGDLNAIEPFDRTLHFVNDLNDTYLELGGQEDSHDGYTWGYQVPPPVRARFGCTRMDKILFRGALQPRAFERIGIDVKVAEAKRQEMRNAGQLEWVTDHYGVMGDFELAEGWQLARGP